MNKYNSYKNSGVSWLGEIPEHWEVIRLGFLGEFSASGIDKYVKKSESLIKIINFTDVYGNINKTIDSSFNFMEVTTPEENRKKHLVKKGDMIFLPSSETYEDLGLSALVNEELENTSFSYHVIRLKITKNIDHSFRKYFTNNAFVLNQFARQGKGSTRKIIGRSVFKNIIVTIPPIEEQTAIANFLDDKTAKIEQAIAIKQKQIELLKERRQILIHKAVTRGLNDNVKFKDSGVEWIGKIPEHWELSKLGLMLTPYSIKNHPNETLLSITREQGVIERDMENLDSNHNFIPEDLSGYKVLKKGDFGMNKMKAWQGSYGVSKFTGIVSPAYFTFSLVDTISPDFFHLAIRSQIYVPFFGQASDGVRIGQWDLSKERMKNIPFVIPSLKEQDEILNYIDSTTNKTQIAISLKEQEIEKLKEYKMSLIDGVVTGKVKVC